MRRTESLFDSFFRDLETNNYQLGKGIDIYKEDNQYVVLIDMPGFNRDYIAVRRRVRESQTVYQQI